MAQGYVNPFLIVPSSEPELDTSATTEDLPNQIKWFPVHPALQKMMTNSRRSRPFEVELLGFDHLGHVFVRLTAVEYMTQHMAGMQDALKDIYEMGKATKLNVDPAEVREGEVVAAIIRDVHGKRMIRSQILEIDDEFVIVNDLDSQMKHKVMYRKIFVMHREVFKTPMMTIMCKLRFVSPFAEGTTAVLEAAKIRTCLTTEHFLANFYSDKGDMKHPLVELYHNYDEFNERIWSFNLDVLSQLIAWNGHLEFEKNMVLENIEITHALPNGRIWIQLKSGVLEAIYGSKPVIDFESVSALQLKNDLEEQLKSDQKLFMIRDQNDSDKFMRVKLLARLVGDTEDVGEVLIEFYDEGIKEVVHKNELIPAAYFETITFDIPPQVFQAQMTVIPIGGLTPEQTVKLTSKLYRKKVMIHEPSSRESKCPKVSVHMLNKAGMRQLKAKEEERVNMLVPRVIHNALFPFPFPDEEVKESGHFFEFSKNISKLSSISYQFPPLTSAEKAAAASSSE